MKSNLRRSIILLGISLLPLFVGTGIYFIFRTPIKAFEILDIVRPKVIQIDQQNPLLCFLIYSFPDALWYMSLLLTQIFFIGLGGFINRFFIAIAFLLPFFLEFAQHFNVIHGTFDWYDILAYCLIIILFLCIKKILLQLYCNR
jgi:hypothetical protein